MTTNTALKGIPFEATGYAPPKPKGFKLKDIGVDLGVDIVDLQRKAPESELPEPMSFKLPNGQTVKGHLGNDIQHSRYPSTRYMTRTYMQTESGQAAQIDFRDLLKTSSLPKFPAEHYTVTASEINYAIQQTGRERQQQLDSGVFTEGLRVVPKDHTLNPVDVHIHLNSDRDVSFRYAEQLSDIGQIEGFHLVAGARDPESMERQLKKLGHDNVSILNAPYGEAWVEDYSEPLLGGGRVTPAIFEDSHYSSLVSTSIREGRQQRFDKLGLDGAFAYHGAVNQGQYQRHALAEGLATNAPLRQGLSYMEGGNNYTGTRPNGDGYVLVGKDSFHVSKRLLEKQTGKPWSDTDVKKAIAADLGLKLENVVPVEQPNAFHLDMRMTSVAPGEFLLQDSVMAANQQIAWMKEDLASRTDLSDKDRAKHERAIEKRGNVMLENARKAKAYEDLTAADLVANGFGVHRIAGSFVDENRPDQDRANFFNARNGTNEQGERFTILMGGVPREEAFMAETFFKESNGTISHLHFLDPSVSRQTLDMMGGLKCRTKPGGDLVSQESIAQPVSGQLQTA